MTLIEKDWEMTFIAPDDSLTDEQLLALANEEIDGLSGEQQLLMSDQVILATAFGQIKLTGRLSRELLTLAYASLNRWEGLYRLVWDWTKKKPPYNIVIMRGDLQRFVLKYPERII